MSPWPRRSSSTSSPGWREAAGFLTVPQSGGRWWITGSEAASFPRYSKVELVSAGRRGVPFQLYWQETCGGNRVGARGVVGGSAGQGRLTLDSAARVLVNPPAAEGTYDGCYLAATVFMRTRTWREASTSAPDIRIVHSA